MANTRTPFRLLVAGTHTLLGPDVAVYVAQCVFEVLRAQAVPSDHPIEIVHGAAPGVDTLAERLAQRQGWRVRAFPAEWNRYRRSAGPIRNQQMIDDGAPDYAVLVWDGESRGTQDMQRRLVTAGVPYTLYTFSRTRRAT